MGGAPPPCALEPIREQLPPDLEELCQAARGEGHHFLDRLRREWQAGSNCFDGPGETLLALRVEGRLAGVGGLNRDPYAGDARCGRLRRIFLLPEYRGRGLGRRLVEELVARARAHFDRLDLYTENPAAAAFYRACGFRPFKGPGKASHRMAFPRGTGS